MEAHRRLEPPPPGTGASLACATSHDLETVANRLGHTSTRMLDTTYLAAYEDAGRGLAIDELVSARLGTIEAVTAGGRIRDGGGTG